MQEIQHLHAPFCGTYGSMFSFSPAAVVEGDQRALRNLRGEILVPGFSFCSDWI
jgi:hypothetical protein